MKRNNLLLLFAVLTIGSTQLNAQIKHVVFGANMKHVGTDGSNSTKLNSLYVDIDEDGTDDFYVSHLMYMSFNIWNLNFNQIDDNSPKIEFIYDKVLGRSQVGGDYLNKMKAGDDVSSKVGNWSSKYPVLGDVYNSNFHGAGEQYVGYRLIMPGGKYKYGWMKLEVSGSTDYTITLKEHAYQTKEDQDLKVGETTAVGIKTIAQRANNIDLTVYPNPSNGLISVQLNEVKAGMKAEVLSVDGKVQFSNEIIELNTQLNLNALPPGMYYVVVSNAEGRVVSPIMLK
ncbi:MAG: hypothetical protein CL840_20540 [Crocinitomicaceae bacterium]|nr:hypothetical protein [Crocinitomicaceae bacterium]|tara:strand:+ start:3679 stop:4533 length:855 start_codon:yes stop_codon:yes gene_type:complete